MRRLRVPFSRVRGFIGRHKLLSLVIGIGVVGLGITASILSPDEIAGDITERERAVKTARVSALSKAGSSIPLIGSVESVSEAVIEAESAGRILYVSYELGDAVRSGAVIAEIENSRERAAVAQSEAALSKLQQGTIRSQTEVRVDAVNTYKSAFTLASDAVFGKTDTLFDAARTSAPRLNITPFGQFSLEDDRAAINTILTKWENTLSGVSVTSDLFALLEEAEDDLTTIRLFLDQLATVVNRQTPSATRTSVTIEAEKAAVFAGRANVNTALANVSNARDELRTILSGSEGGSGEKDADIRAAEAALASARANLARTIIRAPISGTINSLDLEVGNFVSTFTPVATVANNDALKIETFITADERKNLQIGNEVIIEGKYSGVITNIAPGLDATTNKIKVEIGVESGAENLINGDTVRLDVTRTSASDLLVTEPEEIIIPITALKVETDRIVVFTVGSDGTLRAHPIQEGPLVGNSIIILEGVTPDMEIVLDARGLNEGDNVTVL